MTLLAQVAVFLAATVVAVPLFRKLGLGSVLGYLAAGVAIGPWGLAVVDDIEGTLHLAEFGVVLLLFVIGLELQPSRLRVMRRAVLGIGAPQVFGTTVVLATVARALGLDWTAAFVAGFALSLSSTPLVLQLLAERRELNTHHGRSGFAVLLFQDIAVMPVLALLPLIGIEAADRSLAETLKPLLTGLGALLLVVVVGHFGLQPVLRRVADTGVREAFTAAALLVVVATALLASVAGVSMALGAFVAGVLLADSEYRHELEADIEPFKGLLLGLFFIAVGMTLNVGLIVARPMPVIALVLALLLLKMAVLWLIARRSGHDARASRSLAFALPQAGEFGFVIFGLAVANGVLPRDTAELLTIVVTVSMVLSPLLMGLNARVLDPRLDRPPAREFDKVQDDSSRVIIAGFGRFGQIMGRTLRMRRIPFTALEVSPAQVDFVRRFGNKIYYGDASRLELLESAGAGNAEILVVAVDDIQASVRIVEVAKRHFPRLKLFVRAHNRQHALKLMELGVRYVIRDTYLSSLDMARHVLECLGLGHQQAVESIARFRAHDEKTLEQQLAHRDDEQKLIQSAQLAARELEQLFESDAGGSESATSARTRGELT